MSQKSGLSRPTSIKDILENSLPQLLHPQNAELTDLSLAWEKILGKTISTKTEPLSLRHGLLTIQTKSPSWTQELHLLKHEILLKIQDQFPSLKIKDLHFKNKAKVQIYRKK
ncbi:MAG: hypothetical protein A3I75_03290 [Deltaproteobacteria bacterium RIFCSPLOWO2_02_FULL_50_16]|nr:MAG: hypothetical protein A2053_06795 [Deltaproteobacteria bacterium GWA2_50_8]OGQ26636.1 MAG: hypothetical protein A3B79_05895 [Deltaproteobacteria bacterium RIFCSPHIGHO2_02_FULL_50_15]OGQ57752.1 MAG: hypothetical protein A3I75_03290 [Deltaproteobacteria bacterium RIFCSPLOWO2_02_FULL_50_16]OGQ68787.1 MAG: hypothetical protein A3F89_07390 [Deltaproteobacteria bacterium RIFCSPLOWO2_12_FULL_50_11]